MAMTLTKETLVELSNITEDLEMYSLLPKNPVFSDSPKGDSFRLTFVSGYKTYIFDTQNITKEFPKYTVYGSGMSKGFSLRSEAMLYLESIIRKDLFGK